MNGLDSPLESLAFIPVNLGPLLSAVVNNIWAWLAVVTAAVSFWRIRNSSIKTTSSTSHIFLSPPPTPEPAPTVPKTTPFVRKGGVEEEKRETEEEEAEVLTRGNSKKVFTVFCEERENDDHDENEDGEMDGGDYNDDDEVDEVKDEWVMIKRWGSSSELMVEMRGGDLGWYSYQNRKVIDGSVVRLWGEEGEIGCGSPRSCRKRVYSSRKLSTSNSF